MRENRQELWAQPVLARSMIQARQLLLPLTNKMEASNARQLFLRFLAIPYR